MIVVGSDVTDGLPPLADGLIEYDGYSRYPFMDVDKRMRMARGILERHLASSPSLVLLWLGESDQVEGAIVVERFPWGEKHFGIGMAHLQHFWVNPRAGSDDAQRSIRKDLLHAVADWAQAIGVVHLAGRFPTEDYRTIQELENMGGRLMDTIATYTYNTHVVPRPVSVRRLFQIREFEKTDRSEILKLCAGSFRETRFARDPTLQTEAVEAFYADWGERLCAGEMAERLLVAVTTQGDVVGFIGYKLNQDLLKWGGIRVRGGGLGAVSPRAPGAYLALLHQSFVQDTHITDLAEMESQIQNASVIKIWHKLKCQPVRVTHTLHVRL